MADFIANSLDNLHESRLFRRVCRSKAGSEFVIVASGKAKAPIAFALEALRYA